MNWLGQKITLQLKTVNTTHYSFAARPAQSNEPFRVLAYATGELISWGFTGALVGVYATSNGGNGTAAAYIENWNYEGWGQVRDQRNGTYSFQ